MNVTKNVIKRISGRRARGAMTNWEKGIRQRLGCGWIDEEKIQYEYGLAWKPKKLP